MLTFTVYIQLDPFEAVTGNFRTTKMKPWGKVTGVVEDANFTPINYTLNICVKTRPREQYLDSIVGRFNTPVSERMNGPNNRKTILWVEPKVGVPDPSCRTRTA